MTKNIKRFITLIISAVLCFSAVSIFAESNVESLPITGEVSEYTENHGAVMPANNAVGTGQWGTYTPYINGMVGAISVDGSLRIYAYAPTENHIEYKMNIPGRRFIGLTGGSVAMRWQSPGESTIQETRLLVSESGKNYIAFGLNIARKKCYFKSVENGVETIDEIEIEPKFGQSYRFNFNIVGTTISYELTSRTQGNVSGSAEILNIDKLNKECLNQVVYYAKEIITTGEGMVWFDNPTLKIATLPIGEVSAENLKKGAADADGKCALSYSVVDKETKQPLTTLEPNKTVTLYGIGENAGETDANIIVMLGLYKNGVPQKLIPYKLTLCAGKFTKYKASAELTLPADVTGYSVKCFLWPGFNDIRTNFDLIEVK